MLNLIRYIHPEGIGELSVKKVEIGKGHFNIKVYVGSYMMGYCLSNIYKFESKLEKDIEEFVQKNNIELTSDISVVTILEYNADGLYIEIDIQNVDSDIDGYGKIFDYIYNY